MPKPMKDYAPALTSTFTLEAASTVLVLVDLQYASACRTTGLGKKWIEMGQEDVVKWRFDRIEQVVLPNVKKFLSFFRAHKLKILYLTIGSVRPDYSDTPAHLRPVFQANNNHLGTREHEILDEIKPTKEDYVINKTTLSAFNSTGIDSLLRSIGAKHLIFTGVSTNMCVEGTARDASDKGYACVIVEDACSAGQEELHRGAIINFQRFYGRAASADEILHELSQSLARVRTER